MLAWHRPTLNRQPVISEVNRCIIKAIPSMEDRLLWLLKWKIDNTMRTCVEPNNPLLKLDLISSLLQWSRSFYDPTTISVTNGTSQWSQKMLMSSSGTTLSARTARVQDKTKPKASIERRALDSRLTLGSLLILNDSGTYTKTSQVSLMSI